MKKPTFIALGLTGLIVVCCSTPVMCFLDRIIDGIDDLLCDFDKHVTRPLVAKPLKEVAKAIGLVKVKKTYKDFKIEVQNKKVIFTKGSYHVEEIRPCAHGYNHIVPAERPVEIQFEDQKVSLRYKFCKKCGQTFL
mgnify:CR=1 FL=1